MKEKQPKIKADKEKNKIPKRNQKVLDSRILELVNNGYSKEIATKIADLEYVNTATEARRIVTAEDSALTDEVKEKRLLTNDKALIENTRRLEELLKEDDIGIAKRKISENLDNIEKEEQEKLDKRIKSFTEESDKKIEEEQDKYNKKLEEIESKLNESFQGAKQRKEATINAMPIVSTEQEPLKQLDDARTKYAEDYKRFLAERNAKSNWFTRNITRKLFGSKAKEEETPEYLKISEKEYEKATVAYGKQMYSEKEAELKLKSSSMSVNEQREELKRYKQDEIFNKVIIEEQSILNGLKVENLPAKEKGVIKKSLEWYIKQPKWKKVAIATALSTGIIAAASSGTIVAAGGIAAYAGTKYVRGLAGSTIGQAASKAYDWLFKSKSVENRVDQEKELSEEFAEESFDTSLAKGKKEYAEILEKEKKANRRRLITKAMITIAAGGLASYEMGNVLHTFSPEHAIEETLSTKPTVSEHITGKVKIENIPKAHEIKTSGIVKEPEIKTSIKIGKVASVSPKPIISEHPTQEVKTEFKTEKVEFSSKGAIQTIHDLKDKINHDYTDISKAPASVQEFMKANSTEEAIKLGLYNPDSPAESAMLLKGSTLEFDEHGNLSIHDIKTNQESVLIHGETPTHENAPVIEKYHGQMMDSDHQVDHHDQHLGSEDDSSIDENLKESQVNPEEAPVIDKNLEQSQTSPEGNTEINKPVENEIEKPYFLTPERMAEVREVNDTNIKHLFGNNTILWDNVKDSHMSRLSADKMMHMNVDTEGISEDTKKIVSYLNKLHQATGLNPTEETLLTPAETNRQFIERAIAKAASDPKIGLDKVKF